MTENYTKIVFERNHIRLGAVWFDEETDVANLDFVSYYNMAKPMSNAICQEFYTILIDLNKEPEVLLAGMKKYTRYEIRRAATKDNIVYEHWNGSDQQKFTEFFDFYDKFASQKKRPRASRLLLLRMANCGALDLSRVRTEAGEPLVWHAYYRCRGRVTLLFTASLFRSLESSAERNFIGRANRFHHWQDMLRYKAEGYSVYDFGGWYEGNRDQDKLRINKFKEEFGGEVFMSYICERGLTLKGKLVLYYRVLSRVIDKLNLLCLPVAMFLVVSAYLYNITPIKKLVTDGFLI